MPHRKKLFIVALLLATASVAGLVGGVKIYAERGIGFCTPASDPLPNDVESFPYGFMCGGHKDDNAAVSLTASPLAGSPGAPIKIPPNSNIRFDGQYIRSGIPRDSKGGGEQEVLVWTTINGAELLTNEAQILNSSGNQSLKCPGTSGGPNQPGPVFNYRDIQPNGSNGQRASPAAYNPSNNEGKVDCGSSGKMVYWTNASAGAGYGFDLKLNNERQGKICIRMNVSVRFSAGEKYFPDSSAFGFDQGDQNVVASHVAKQSQERCYLVENSVPTGTFSFNTCERANYTVNVADRDNPGQSIPYRFLNSSRAVVHNGSAISGVATNGTFARTSGSYTLQVRDQEINPSTAPGAWVDKQTRSILSCDEPVENGTMLINCDLVYGNSSYKNKRYKMFVFGVANNNEIKRGATGPTEGRYQAPIAGTTPGGVAYDGRGGTTRFIMRIYAGNEDTTSVIQTIDTSSFPPADCNDDPPFRSIVAMNCSAISINVSDPDDRGQGVYYELDIYQDADPGKKTTYSGRGTGTLPPFTYPGESAPNNGWHAYLRVKNIREPGRFPPYDNSGAFTSNDFAAVGPCYNAACSLNSVTASPGGTIPGESPNAGVAATRQFDVNYTLTNTGAGDRNPLYPSIGPAQLAMRRTGGTSPGVGSPATYPVGRQVELGASITGSMTFTAPANAGTYTVEVYPDYDGLFPIGGGCSLTFDTFQPFEIEPHADVPNAQPNSEEPSRIDYQTRILAPKAGTPHPSGSRYLGPPIRVQGVNQLNYIKYQAPPGTSFQKPPPLDEDAINNTGKQSDGSLNGSDTWQRIWNRPLNGEEFRPGDRWQAGDQYCGRIQINYTMGWSNRNTADPDPSIRILGTSGGPAEDINCGQIQNNPYVRVYGNDVASSGSIKGFTANGQQGAGSGTEFAAIATTIDFATAFFRNPAPAPPVAENPVSPDGLKFLSSRDSINYYDETIKRETRESTPITVSSTGLPTSAGVNNQTLYKPSRTLTLNGGTFDGRHAMYVEGDVFIEGNIIYSSTSYSSVEDITSFALMVKGNIYISKDVSQLDGIYVSQGGKIFTCVKTNGVPYDGSNGQELIDDCNDQQLKVNGLFAADDIKFLRTQNTLRDVPYVLSGTTRIYSPREYFGTTKAAEAFLLTPEIILSQYGEEPIFRSEGSQTGGKFDYYVTLPPVL